MTPRVHGNRCYVKLAGIGLAAAAMAFASPARAETVFPGQVTDARLAVRSGFAPVVAYTVDGPTLLNIAQRGPSGWQGRQLGLGRHEDVEIDGAAIDPNDGRAVVLLRQRDGAWLALWYRGKLHAFHRDSKRALFGPAGLALDRRGLPVVAYALWFPTTKTYLRLARATTAGRWTVRGVTRKGFPATRTLAAAAPIVLPSGEVRVVETYLPAGVEWHILAGDWWGQFLHSSALGVPVGRIDVAVSGKTTYSAWTEAFPTLGPPGVVLATHADHVESGVALEDAVLAGLALTADGPELAANRCIPAAAFGLDEGNGVCGGLVASTAVDGIVADYEALASERQLLVQTDEGLQWYDSPGSLSVQVSLTPQLTGRVEGGAGGSVLLYRERPGQRTLLGSFPVAQDGTFAAGDPTATAVTAAYRAVYVDPATGIRYAALIGPP